MRHDGYVCCQSEGRPGCSQRTQPTSRGASSSIRGSSVTRNAPRLHHKCELFVFVISHDCCPSSVSDSTKNSSLSGCPQPTKDTFLQNGMKDSGEIFRSNFVSYNYMCWEGSGVRDLSQAMMCDTSHPSCLDGSHSISVPESSEQGSKVPPKNSMPLPVYSAPNHDSPQHIFS